MQARAGDCRPVRSNRHMALVARIGRMCGMAVLLGAAVEVGWGISMAGIARKQSRSPGGRRIRRNAAGCHRSAAAVAIGVGATEETISRRAGIRRVVIIDDHAEYTVDRYVHLPIHVF